VEENYRGLTYGQFTVPVLVSWNWQAFQDYNEETIWNVKGFNTKEIDIEADYVKDGNEAETRRKV
jgi:hypothetical protein